MEQIFVGMDLHKKRSSFCVMDKEGQVLKEVEVRTCATEVEKFIKSLGKKKKIKLVMEPLSQWYFYADFISNLGVEVILAHPLKVKAIAFAKIKTDKIDAKILGDLLRTNLLPTAYYAPKHVRDWKELCRGRMDLVDHRIGIKNQIHAILFRNGLNYSRSFLFTKKGLEWVKGLEFNSIYKSVLNANLNTLEDLSIQINILEKVLENTVKENEEMKLLCTIPGISKITAITIMSEIGDIDRFPSAKKLHSHAGLVPTIRNSGGRINHGNISKQGSSNLRYIMIQTAQHQKILKHIVGLKWFYERMLLNKKNSKTAVVATARKLLTVVFNVLSQKRPYEERLPKTYSSISSI